MVLIYASLPEISASPFLRPAEAMRAGPKTKALRHQGRPQCHRAAALMKDLIHPLLDARHRPQEIAVTVVREKDGPHQMRDAAEIPAPRTSAGNWPSEGRR